MPDCEKCGCFEDEKSDYIADNVCLSVSDLEPVFLKKDIFGKFIPHKKCPYRKKKNMKICLCCGQEIIKKQEN